MSAMLATATNPLRVGLRQERVIAPQCLVIFGASGDLTHCNSCRRCSSCFGNAACPVNSPFWAAPVGPGR